MTGDIADTGKPEEYDKAISVFEELRTEHRKRSNAPLEIKFCPGNHDCNFDNDTKARQLIIEAIRGGNKQIDESVVKVCTEVQRDYFDFLSKVNFVGADAGLLTRRSILKIGEHNVRIDSLNSSWLSTISDHKNVRFYPVDDLTCDEDVSLSIALSHHPESWFASEATREFRSAISQNYHFILGGHEHLPDARSIRNIGSQYSSIFVDGGVIDLDEAKFESSTLNVISISISDKVYCHITTNLKSLPEAKFERWEKLSNPGGGTFDALLQEFRDSLDDPGLGLIHPRKKNLALDDIYVDPEIIPLDFSTSGVNLVDTSIKAFSLLDELEETGCVVVSGDDYSGKTVLAKALFLKCMENGLTPVLISRDRFERTKVLRVKKSLEIALNEQYKSVSASGFFDAELNNR